LKEKTVIPSDGKLATHYLNFKEFWEILNSYQTLRYHISVEGQWVTAVGYLGYDAVRFFEPTLKLAESDDLKLPETIFMIADLVIIFDHLTRRMKIVVLAHVNEGDDLANVYEKAKSEIKNLAIKLSSTKADLPAITPFLEVEPAETVSNISEANYMEMVEKAKEFILSGDIFQVVLSQRFETRYSGNALHLYRTLWMVNPSPYMFCMEFEDFSIVGSSPEVHVRLTGKKVEIRPIAGTRKRGATAAEDKVNEAELLEDPKERAEHIMLIDLARNDVGRDAEFGSVQVTDLMSIERFSHVMHIVSSIEGTLRENRNAFDVMRSTFPAGTVSGSPKIRAMQIISQFEPCQRGVYSGAIGYFGFDGNMDSCIALRTVVLKNGRAFVQAGGGIVADSTPKGEYEETRNKARGMLRAIARAEY
jgi:anthranilate synthase component I